MLASPISSLPFSEEETEAQRHQGACLGSHSHYGAELGLVSEPYVSCVYVLSHFAIKDVRVPEFSLNKFTASLLQTEDQERVIDFGIPPPPCPPYVCVYIKLSLACSDLGSLEHLRGHGRPALPVSGGDV